MTQIEAPCKCAACFHPVGLYQVNFVGALLPLSWRCRCRADRTWYERAQHRRRIWRLGWWAARAQP